jgi:hypothetical protein
MNAISIEAAFRDWWEKSYKCKWSPPNAQEVMTHVAFAEHMLQLIEFLPAEYQPKPEGPIATEHARTQEINDLIAETVYGPRGSETSACANAWEVSKLIASLQTRVKALEALPG